MSAANWQRILDLFEQVVELPADERCLCLDRSCRNGKERRAVEDLLAIDDEQDIAEASAVSSAPRSHLPKPRGIAGSGDPEAPSGDGLGSIGPYRLVRQVGQGGMSTVYLAVRNDDTFRRDVVIKLVREGMESETILRRLRTERQILADLDHPHIARLIDGGSTEAGFPYFVMEYVEGLPIDEYCRQNRLSVEERLKLFRKVCSAVQYAHRHLVVHRDIKPSNILVTPSGDPKLLDFGIAKLLDPDSSADSEPTAAWYRVLTPSYASPEQLAGRRITTASDIYSLGVLLYKLLTGTLPRSLKGRSPHDLEQDLLEREPPAPSAALIIESELAGGPESVDDLRRRLRGDLDAIVLRALRSDPAQRYESVDRLAEDIERYGTGRPVVARQGSRRYRAGKFVRRHRLGVTAAASVAMLLAGFMAAIAWQSARVAEERDQARRERDEKQAVLTLILDVFRLSHPYARPGEKLTVHEALQRSVPLLETGLQDQPAVRAALLHGSGVIMNVIGEPLPAATQLQEALTIRSGLHGEHHADVAETEIALASAYKSLGRLDEAEALARGVVDQVRRDGPGGRGQLTAGLVELASIFCYRGDFQGAEGPAEEALDLVQELRTRPDQAIVAREYMAQIRSSQGRYDEAAALYREALAERRRHYGEKHPSQIPALGNLGIVLRRSEDFAAALHTYQEVLALERMSFGEDYKDPITYSSLAGLLLAQGEYGRARAVYGEALEAVIATRGPENWRVLLYALRAEQARLRLGQPAEAEVELRHLLAVWRPRLGDDHVRIAQAESVLGESLSVQGRCEEAEPLMVQAFKKLTKAKHRLRKDAFDVLRDHLQRCGRPQEIVGHETELSEP